MSRSRASADADNELSVFVAQQVVADLTRQGVLDAAKADQRLPPMDVLSDGAGSDDDEDQRLVRVERSRSQGEVLRMPDVQLHRTESGRLLSSVGGGIDRLIAAGCTVKAPADADVVGVGEGTEVASAGGGSRAWDRRRVSEPGVGSLVAELSVESRRPMRATHTALGIEDPAGVWGLLAPPAMGTATGALNLLTISEGMDEELPAVGEETEQRPKRSKKQKKGGRRRSASSTSAGRKKMDRISAQKPASSDDDVADNVSVVRAPPESQPEASGADSSRRVMRAPSGLDELYTSSSEDDVDPARRPQRAAQTTVESESVNFILNDVAGTRPRARADADTAAETLGRESGESTELYRTNSGNLASSPGTSAEVGALTLADIVPKPKKSS